MKSPDALKLRVTRFVSLCGAVALAAGVVSCTPRPDGPEPAAQDFLSAFAERDIVGAAELTDRPDDARPAMDEAWKSLQAVSLEAESTDVDVSGDTATVGYSYEWHLPKERVWTYTGELQMGRSGADWSVRWNSANLHPRLGDKQTMVLRAERAEWAHVNEQAGSDVLVPGVVYRIEFDASEADNVVGTAQALSSALNAFDDAATPQAIVESATAVDGNYLVTTLSEEDYDQIASALDNMPGVIVSEVADLVPTDPNFAPDLVGQVKKTIIDDVQGEPGWSVVVLNRNGAEIGVLTETAPEPLPSVSISLDRPIQEAAQQAVDARTDQAMMVVIEPSTGNLLAVAQNEAADRDGPVALMGLYPPGSTFKIVTAGAAISSGLAMPETIVPCPGRIVIGERSIPNYNLFSLGNVSMATAFARSCNTSFAKLASEMQPDALNVAASQFGIGPDYSVVGLPTATGSVPPAKDLAQRTEDGFGQGRVVVSPFGMALAAATIANGSTPVPQLIKGRETTIEGEHPEISRKMVDGLREMMRLVVTSGTAIRIADQGEVYGKTGEAEAEGGSHAWFVGYRGDLAFATLIVHGGSSDNAVAVTRDMLTALPEGY